MTINKTRSETMHKITFYYKIIHIEHQSLRGKPKQGIITESLSNPQLSRDYIEKKKTLEPFFTKTLTASLNPIYCTSPFIEKIKVTNCDISKLPLICGLSFLYREAFRLDLIRCASLHLRDVPLLCRSECSSRNSE